ncbi:MAG TPA: helix-turn-helix transcriptional regulator [Capillimicrobium sp.]|nr:helix-turn-helix transcriptional regulator [Capillimicrobium sp.]
MSTSTVKAPAPIGALLREWRQRRRLSQLDLALDAGISARHLSFVETGRARPSAEMVLHLANQLDVPLRERNRLLLAAGYAPVFEERSLDDPEMAPVHEAVQLVLDGHDPYPAITVDHGWALVAYNRGAQLLMAGLPEHLLAPPMNVLRASLHPEGLAPRIVNLAQWREHLLERLGRQAALTGDPALRTLYAELESYPVEDGGEPAHGAPERSDVVVPLRLRTDDGELRFFSTVTTFGTPVDITVEELSIESFFPADRATAEVLRRHAETASAR